MPCRVAVLSLFTCLLLCSPAIGQSNYSDLGGTVVDPQAGAIVGADVQLTSVNTRSERRVATDDQGMFRIDGLLPGDYRLTVAAPRFATLSRTLSLVLLDFWAVSCAPCRDAMPTLEAIHHEYKDRGLLILGINVGEEPQTVEPFLKKTPAPYPTLLDTSSDVAKLFHVNLLPTFILIDPDGKVVDWKGGFLKAGANSTENIGESLLRGMLQDGITGNVFAK